MCTAYYTAALAIFAAIVINPVPSQLRRICGAVLDMGLLSWLMYHSGAETVPFFRDDFAECSPLRSTAAREEKIGEDKNLLF